MKKTISLLLAAGTVTAVAMPAAAQDNSAFTGPRVEIVGGYDISNAGSSVDNDVNEDDDQSIDGFMYGVGLGYDFAVGGAVLGVEAELSDSTAETEFRNGDLEDLGLGTRVGAGRDIYLGARAGILVNPNTLVYAKGGYTNATYDLLLSDNVDEREADFDLDGFRVGAGAEYAMSENSFVKLEYRYSNYSSAELDRVDDDFFDEDMGDVDLGEIDLDRHQVTVGVGFRF
ncbi:MAG: porin family protein [Alteraurantiacibacter sp.]